MFFHKSIFERIGGFNEKLGPGTPFICEDIEMAARASMAGFLGAQVPFFNVVHHHKRLKESVEADLTDKSYDYRARGLLRGSPLSRAPPAWQLWASCTDLRNIRDQRVRMQLVRELEAAAKYLASLQ